MLYPSIPELQLSDKGLHIDLKLKGMRAPQSPTPETPEPSHPTVQSFGALDSLAQRKKTKLAADAKP